MNKTLKNTLIIVGILLIIIFPFVKMYNNMVRLDQKVKSSESNIDTQLQRRSDLIPNLVETVKAYASQEKEIFTEIADARSKLNNAQNINEKANADNDLSSALSRLLVVVEKYPDLKSNENFKDLSIALEGSENRISVARQDYNKAVDAYNTTIKKFPNSIIAGIGNFEEKSYYEASEDAKDVPKVDFKLDK